MQVSEKKISFVCASGISSQLSPLEKEEDHAPVVNGPRRTIIQDFLEGLSDFPFQHNYYESSHIPCNMDCMEWSIRTATMAAIMAAQPFKFKTSYCPAGMKCHRGDRCTFAHSEAELICS